MSKWTDVKRTSENETTNQLGDAKVYFWLCLIMIVKNNLMRCVNRSNYLFLASERAQHACSINLMVKEKFGTIAPSLWLPTQPATVHGNLSQAVEGFNRINIGLSGFLSLLKLLIFIFYYIQREKLYPNFSGQRHSGRTDMSR